MTEDNELIECMGKAICVAVHGETAWIGASEDAREAFRIAAHAALTAYRNHQVEL